MSKKKKNILKSHQNNLWDLFRKYVTRKSNENSFKRFYQDFWDDDYDDQMERLRRYYGYDDMDDADVVYPPKDKAKVIDINTPYSGFEEDPDEVDTDKHEIYFYKDYHHQYDYIKFNSYAKFKKYCDEEGYYLSNVTICDVLYWHESHCCVGSGNTNYDTMEVVADSTYENLFYDVCEDDELGVNENKTWKI